MHRHCQPQPFLATHRWIDFTNDEQYPKQLKELVRLLKGKKPQRM
jgi:hypothetical protein